MNERIPASVGILTFNSAATLERALESVKDFEDIIICDGGSTDGTLEIARRYGAHIVPQDPSTPSPGPIQDFAAVRNRCLDAARTDWFFYIDSDERAEPELVREIAEVVRQAPAGPHVYRISPRIVYRGRRIEHSSNYPGYQIRFFKRGEGVQFRKPIHESIEYPSDTSVHTLQGHWNYYFEGPEEFLIDLSTRDLPAIMRRYESKPFWWKLLGIKNEFWSMFRIMLFSLWNLTMHPKSAMPWGVERTRIFVHWRSLLALLGIPYHYASQE